MANKQPTVTGRGIGAELRAIRESQRLTTRKVAERLGWPQSKLSKLETGKQRITPADVSALLVVYGVTGDTREDLVSRAERADEQGLVEPRHGLSRESRTLIQLENEATSIFSLQPLLIPGLLQLPDYIRTLMKNGGVPEEETEIRVVTRIGRQALLSRDAPPLVEFVIDEGALHRPMLTPRLMSRQLRHVVEAAERPNVIVRVLPLSRAGENAVEESFTLFDYTSQKSVVYLDHKITGLFLEKAPEIAFYRQEVARLREVALSADDSAALISTLAQKYDEG